MPRHVLFINRVYPPDRAATGQMLAELASALVARGWRVSVVVQRTVPDSPAHEVVAGVEVHRVASIGFTRRSLWRRALSYLSLYPTLLARARRIAGVDVVVTMTDPPLQQALALAVPAPAVHWAQDIYPELAVALGVLPGWAAAPLRRLSSFCLRRHARVVVIGTCMADRLAARGVDRAALAVIPNWADTARVRPVGGNFRTRHGLGAGPLVMYSGNLGLAHPFGDMLDAAESLPDVRFVFVGDGPRLAWVQAQVGERGLANVSFLPFQPADELAASLSAADLHLASMEPALCGLVVPSKVYGVMAAGRPCLFLGPAESEAARALAAHDAGESVAPGALAATIRAWLDDPPRCRAAGARARAAAEAWGAGPAAEAFAVVLDDAATRC